MSDSRLFVPGPHPEPVEDLWEAAARSLSDDLRSAIEPRADRRNVLEGALAEATQKQKQCVEKRWKIKNKKGDVIILRDVFEKIITCINSFKGIGDSVANMGPGWAAIPWALVGVLLKVVVADNETFATMVEGLEKTTTIISRYSIFEVVYLKNNTAATSQLRSSLVPLYASVLTFLGESHRYFARTTTKRFMKAFVFDSGVEDLLEDISTKQAEVDRDSLLVATEVLQSTAHEIRSLSTHSTSVTSQLTVLGTHLERIQQSQVVASDIHALRDAITTMAHPVQRVVATVPFYIDGLDSTQRKIILDWLSPITYKIQHVSERHRRLPDSGAWMFSSDEFRAWKDSSISGTLWLHGMPGCGKTKLLSAVVDYELKETEKHPSSVPVAYFYCSRNTAEPERSNPVQIMRCIARQLCGEDLSNSVPEQLRRVHESLGSPMPGTASLPLHDTVDIILNLLKKNPATIIIDALDECDPSSRHELFEALDEIVAKSENIVKVFLTSRNDGDIVARLASTPNIYIDAQKNSSDIGRFITAELERVVQHKQLLRGQVSQGLKDLITSTLNDRADGMFRWVTLQIQNLCDTRRMRIERDVRAELGRLPSTLADLYSISFDQILALGEGSSHLAIKALTLLLAAVRPMSWAEFLYLLSLSSHGAQQITTKDEVLHVACNFIEPDLQTDRVAFPHLSAREYLETRSEFNSSRLHITAAQICLFGIKDPAAPTSPAYEGERIVDFTYPILYLGDHLARLTVSDRRGIAFLNDLLSDPVVFRDYTRKIQNVRTMTGNWKGGRLTGYTRTYDDVQMATTVIYLCSSPLAMICLYGLEEFLPQELATSGTESVYQVPEVLSSRFFGSIASAVSRLRENKRSYLEIGVVFGHSNLLRGMSSLGISMDLYNELGMTPLHVACSEGKDEMIRVLVGLGADPNRMTRPEATKNVQDPPDYRRTRPSTGLGFRPGDTVAQGMTPSIFGTEQELRCPIHIAISMAKSITCVKILVELGADTNLRTSNGTTPLQLCFELGDGSEKIVEFLLARGADPNAKIGMGRSMLHVAGAMGLGRVVDLLVAAGADVTARDTFGQTPWDNATRYGHDGIAEVLARVGGRPDVSQHSMLDNYREDDEESEEYVFDDTVEVMPPDNTVMEHWESLPQVMMERTGKMQTNAGVVPASQMGTNISQVNASQPGTTDDTRISGKVKRHWAKLKGKLR